MSGASGRCGTTSTRAAEPLDRRRRRSTHCAIARPRVGLVGGVHVGVDRVVDPEVVRVGPSRSGGPSVSCGSATAYPSRCDSDAPTDAGRLGMIVRQSDNAEDSGQDDGAGKSLSDNGPAWTRRPRRSTADAVRHAQPRALLDRRPGRRGAAPRGVRGRAGVRDAAARGRARRVAGGLATDLREALAVLVAEGLATREPNRGVQRRRARPRVGARRVDGARTVLETAGVRHWPTPREEAREAVRRALARLRARRSPTGASYQELNQRHLAIHLSLVGLTESPRLVAMAESIVAELRLALAQIDRVRRNARDQAGSPPPPARPARGRRHRRRRRRARRPLPAPRTRSSSGSTSAE